MLVSAVVEGQVITITPGAPVTNPGINNAKCKAALSDKT